MFLQLQKADFKTLHELLNRVPWDSCFLSESIKDCWIHFKDILLSITDQCIPKIILRHRKNQHWLSTETLNLVHRKRQAYKLAKPTNNPRHQQQYKVISNQVRSLTRKDHTRHLDQITANLTQDQRPFWRWLKNIRGQQAQIPNIYCGCDGTVLTTPTEKASFFNQHFSSIFTPENTSNLNELRGELDASWGHDAVSEITIC